MNDLINLAAGAGVALLVGNAIHHRKRAQVAEAAAVDINRRLDRLAKKKQSTRAPAPAAPPPPKSASASGLSRDYDAIFARLGEGIPVPYLRALAWGESRLTPSAKNGDARGLFQIVPVVLADYNRRAGATLAPSDLYPPEQNTMVAASALRAMVASYARNHRDVPSLLEDWTNPAFVELVTFGWCAGWSERAGVGCVVRYLTSQLGTTDITLDVVAQHAAMAGASRHLSNPRKVRYAKAVTRRYFVERDRDAKEGR